MYVCISCVCGTVSSPKLYEFVDVFPSFHILPHQTLHVGSNDWVLPHFQISLIFSWFNQWRRIVSPLFWPLPSFLAQWISMEVRTLIPCTQHRNFLSWGPRTRERVLVHFISMLTTIVAAVCGRTRCLRSCQCNCWSLEALINSKEISNLFLVNLEVTHLQTSSLSQVWLCSSSILSIRVWFLLRYYEVVVNVGTPL